VSAGVYLYRLKAGRAVETGRMTLLDGGGSTGHAAGAYHARTAKTTGASSPVTWMMSVAAEGFAAFADTFIVYDGLSEGRKDVIMQRKGGGSDAYSDRIGCKLDGCWGDENGSEENPPARFTCGFWKDGSYDSSSLKEKGVFIQVPWSHATVDSVYLTITESAYPERVNLTIPLVIHFWEPMCPLITNMKALSNSLLDTEIASLIYMVVGKQSSDVND
jgi:hypothetical protein